MLRFRPKQPDRSWLDEPSPFDHAGETMNRTQLLNLHESMCAKARDLMVAKNQDYAKSDEVFGNLSLCETMGLCRTTTGIVIRITDKIRRLAGYETAKTLAVKDESVEDTILDLINYLVLYRAKMLEETDGCE